MSTQADPRPRPSCAPLAPPAAALAAGIVADRCVAPCGTLAWAAIAGGAAAIALALCRRRGSLPILAILAAFAALGGGWHHHRWSDLAADDLARGDWSSPRPAWVRGVLGDVPEFHPGDQAGDAGFTRAALVVCAVRDGQDWRPCSGRLRVTISGDRTDLHAGEPVEAAGTLEAIAAPRNPGEFDRRRFERAEGIRLRLTVGEPASIRADPEGASRPFTRLLGSLRARSHARLVRGLDPAVAPLAAALLLGRREAVDPDVNDAFLRTGTTHLLAISGLHLQALAGALWLAFGIALGRKPAYALVILATAAYAMLVGLMPSVVRSATMTIAICFAGLIDRCAHRANTLAMAALATLAVNPADLFDVGCQLSFLAVAALFWGVAPALRRLGIEVERDAPEVYAFAGDAQEAIDPLDALERRLEPWWMKLARRAWRMVVAGLVVSAVVWAVGLPLAALRFHLVSPVGILLNVPLIPLTSAALLAAGLALVLSLAWGPLGIPAAWACGCLLRWTEWIVRWGAARTWGHAFVAGPTAPWVLAFYALLATAALASAGHWAMRRWPWGLLGAVTAMGTVAALWPGRPGALEADVLAVDHGLAVVVQGGDGRTVLYDCGRLHDPHVGRRVIAPALWSRRAQRIDAVILSHADADHYDGLPDLLDRFAVGVVRVPPGFEGAANPGAGRLLAAVRARGVPVRPIVAGDRIDLGGGATLTALHPPAAAPTADSDNARSVVVEAADAGRRLLLTGDLDGSGLVALIERPTRPFDAILAPHHGGRTANPPWLYRWADPASVVVSQRRPPPWARDPLAPLAGRGVPLLRTWQSGAIRLRWSRSGLLALGFRDQARGSPDHTPGVSYFKFEISNFLIYASAWARGLLTALGVSLGLAACLVLATIEWGAWALVRPGRGLSPPEREPGPWEPIEALAADGVRLRGSWRRAAVATGRTALLLHGFAEDRSALRGRAEALADRGWNVALLDVRGRGESEGHHSSFGGREGDDLRAWLDALADRVGPDFAPVAWGRSMGAAIALRGADDGRLRALVLEAPYADLRRAVGAWLARLRLPRLLAGPILRRARRLAGVPLDRPRPIDLAAGVRLPALILHGTDDPVVPLADARRLADAFPDPAELVEVAGARHSDVFDVGGPELAGRIAAFLDDALSRRAGDLGP
jgi:competence protein ComEC